MFDIKDWQNCIYVLFIHFFKEHFLSVLMRSGINSSVWTFQNNYKIDFCTRNELSKSPDENEAVYIVVRYRVF